MDIDILAIAVGVGIMILYSLVVFCILMLFIKWWNKREEKIETENMLG
jgi:amino acid transporter